jgi:hypothetical protein
MTNQCNPRNDGYVFYINMKNNSIFNIFLLFIYSITNGTSSRILVESTSTIAPPPGVTAG